MKQNGINKIIKTVLLGLIVWVIPFLSGFFVGDMKVNAPSIDIAWSYALMGLAGAIGIAAYFQFKNVHKNSVKEGGKLEQPGKSS